MDEGTLHVEPEFSIPRKGINVLLLNGQKLLLPDGVSWEQFGTVAETGWSALRIYDADHKEIAVFEPGAYGGVFWS